MGNWLIERYPRGHFAPLFNLQDPHIMAGDWHRKTRTPSSTADHYRARGWEGADLEGLVRGPSLPGHYAPMPTPVAAEPPPATVASPTPTAPIAPTRPIVPVAPAAPIVANAPATPASRSVAPATPALRTVAPATLETKAVAINLDAAIRHLQDKAESTSLGYCARYVRQAINAGGLILSSQPGSAKNYGPPLLDAGYKALPTAGYTPAKGDIFVMQPPTAGSAHGHIAMFDGSIWISDFKQRDMWGGPTFRKVKPPYVIYRP